MIFQEGQASHALFIVKKGEFGVRRIKIQIFYIEKITGYLINLITQKKNQGHFIN